MVNETNLKLKFGVGIYKIIGDISWTIFCKSLEKESRLLLKVKK